MSAELSAPAAAFVAAGERDLAGGMPAELSDADLAAVLTTAVRLYASRAEDAGTAPTPLHIGELSTTDVLTAACDMIRQTGVNMFDVSLWFARRDE